MPCDFARTAFGRVEIGGIYDTKCLDLYAVIFDYLAGCRWPGTNSPHVISPRWHSTRDRHVTRDMYDTVAFGFLHNGHWLSYGMMMPWVLYHFTIWRRRNPFSQWQRSFQWKLRSHWLKVLRQRHVTVIIQSTGGCPDITTAMSPHLHSTRL